MSAFLYTVALQWKLDIRSKTLLITCYVVPLIFFAIMGGIFTSVNPMAKDTLIQSMTVMGVSMGALIGLPPSINELYGGDSKKVYQANGVPVLVGLISMALSAFIHLLIVSLILYAAAPLVFDAAPPSHPMLYFAALAITTVVSISIGCVLGLAVKQQAKLTMVSQLVFLPSIMLSGILFPSNMLPAFLEDLGKLFPATWGYELMQEGGFCAANLWPLIAILLAMIFLCGLLQRRMGKE